MRNNVVSMATATSCHARTPNCLL